jgi:cobyric acid synthase
MADSRRPLNEELRPEEDQLENELEREERRLERLRLVVSRWPTAQRFDDFDPDPQEAA